MGGEGEVVGERGENRCLALYTTLGIAGVAASLA